MNKIVIDLSHNLYEGMPVWPTHPGLRYGFIKRIQIDNYSLTRVDCMTTHTGTHIDGPAHFLTSGKTIDRIDISRFAGTGLIVDLSFKKSGEEITENDLRGYNKKIRRNDVLMLHTGWDRYYGLNENYLFLWPHLTTEAANYLASKKVKAVGIDTLSIGGWADSVPGHGKVARSSPAEVHRILLSREIVIVEELANLRTVIKKAAGGRAFFAFPPLNFVGAEGGPCRAIAFI